MKSTIKKRIFTSNLLTITLLLIITTIAFKFVVGTYLERDTLKQLNTIASRAENAMRLRPPHPFRNERSSESDLMQSYIALIMALRVSSSTINAEYGLIDANGSLITPFEDFDRKPSTSDIQILEEIESVHKAKGLDEFVFSKNSTEYAAVLRPIKQMNGPAIGTLILYTNFDKSNEIQNSINLILLAILVVSAFLMLLLANYLSRGISTPLSALCSHIRQLSELNFSNTLYVPADNEIQELVQNINLMAQKLDTHNKSQKIFLQNASHEFRTPIMSIQCHAEGILYGVVDSREAAKIILEESKRLTHMVEELLYLSRLDAIEEVYTQDAIDITELIRATCKRLSAIAEENHTTIHMDFEKENLLVCGDSDKLERCFSNVMTNCIRYAESRVDIQVSGFPDKIRITVSDDGPGFEENEEKNIFNRFYKGKKGNTGLGLAISKSIVEKHHGTITARNTPDGAQFIIELPVTMLNR